MSKIKDFWWELEHSENTILGRLVAPVFIVGGFTLYLYLVGYAVLLLIPSVIGYSDILICGSTTTCGIFFFSAFLSLFIFFFSAFLSLFILLFGYWLSWVFYGDKDKLFERWLNTECDYYGDILWIILVSLSFAWVVFFPLQFLYYIIGTDWWDC